MLTEPGTVGLQGMGKEEWVVEVAFGMVAASLEISVLSSEGLSSRGGYWCHLYEFPLQ